MSLHFPKLSAEFLLSYANSRSVLAAVRTLKILLTSTLPVTWIWTRTAWA